MTSVKRALLATVKFVIVLLALCALAVGGSVVVLCLAGIILLLGAFISGLFSFLGIAALVAVCFALLLGASGKIKKAITEALDKL